MNFIVVFFFGGGGVRNIEFILSIYCFIVVKKTKFISSFYRCKTSFYLWRNIGFFFAVGVNLETILIVLPHALHSQPLVSYKPAIGRQKYMYTSILKIEIKTNRNIDKKYTRMYISF